MSESTPPSGQHSQHVTNSATHGVTGSPGLEALDQLLQQRSAGKGSLEPGEAAGQSFLIIYRRPVGLNQRDPHVRNQLCLEGVAV